MALGRGHRNSRLLWKIIAFIWLIVTLSEVKSTLKVRGVSTGHFNCTKTEVWLNLPPNNHEEQIMVIALKTRWPDTKQNQYHTWFH